MSQLSLFAEMPKNAIKTKFSVGVRLRDAGIKQAIDHANKEEPSWSDKAHQFLANYIQSHKEFMVEDVRQAAKGIVPEPPSKRAWGGIIRTASRKRLVRSIGIRQVTNPNAHCANAAVWVKI